MIILKNPKNKDYFELKKLWKTCFDEKQEALDLFFEKAMEFTDVYCAILDEKIVSALYLIKSTLNGKNAHYIFAVATLPDYRKRGIMGELMEYALEDSKRCGDAYSLLFPANEKLYNFYEKFGYTSNCTASIAEINRMDIKGKTYFDECDFQKLQRDCFENNFLLQNNNFIEFAKDYYKIYGVKVVQSNSAFALIDEKEDRAEIFYSVYTDFEQLLTLVLENTTAEKLVFTVKSDNADFKNTQKIKFGMINYLDNTEIPDDVYIGITLN